MVATPTPEPLEHDVPVCQVDCVNTEVVNRIKPHLDQVSNIVFMFKALADDTRAKIVYALSEAELCVCDVAAVIGSTKATASYHLRLLYHMGLAKYRKHGKLVYYRLANPHIQGFIRETLDSLSSAEGRDTK